MMREWMLGLGMMTLAALLPACGDNVTEGNGGSGGTGGSGASGGAGGTGGCGSGSGGSGAECAAPAGNSPSVGFTSPPETSGAAVVEAVLPDRVDLTLAADGSMLGFHWVGPDLTGHFQVGEMVTVGGGLHEWHYVIGGTAVAAAISDSDWFFSDLPPLPVSGPAIGFSVQCSWVEWQGGCGQSPRTASVLDVAATWNGETTTIPHDTTADVGPWQIHNAGAMEWSPYEDELGTVEGDYYAHVTALGPAAPQP